MIGSNINLNLHKVLGSISDKMENAVIGSSTVLHLGMSTYMTCLKGIAAATVKV